MEHKIEPYVYEDIDGINPDAPEWNEFDFLKFESIDAATNGEVGALIFKAGRRALKTGSPFSAYSEFRDKVSSYVGYPVNTVISKRTPEQLKTRSAYDIVIARLMNEIWRCTGIHWALKKINGEDVTDGLFYLGDTLLTEYYR